MRLLRASLLAVAAAVVAVFPVFAAAYSATYTVDNTGSTNYTMLPVFALADNTWMAANGFMELDALDTRILRGTVELPHLVADDKTLTALAVAADRQANLSFTTGNADLISMDIITGYDGYITITDDATMEPANIFNFDLTGYIDTTAGLGKNLLYKKESLIIYINDDLSIRASILGAAAWVDPTSFTDPDAAWQNEANVYDNNLATFSDTTVAVAVTSWSSFIHIVRGTTNLEEVRFMANMVAGQIDQVDVDIFYDAAWYDLYQGTYLDDAVGTIWNEYDISGIADDVAQIRFRFYNSDGAVTRTPQLIEVDYGEATVSLSVTATNVAVGEHRVMVDADNTDFEIFIDNMVTPVDTIAQAGASVPDTANDWLLMRGNSISYASQIVYTNESTTYDLGEFTGEIDDLLFNGTIYTPKWLKIPGIAYGLVAFSGSTVTGNLATFTLTNGGVIGAATTDTAFFEAGVSDGSEPYLISLDNSAYFAVVYSGPDTDGWIKTFSVNGSGIISAMIGSLEFDGLGTVWRPQIRHLSGTNYAIAYPYHDGGYKNRIVAVNIENDGTGLAIVDGPDTIGAVGMANQEALNIEQVSGTTYALAYREDSSDDLIIKTITLENDGTIGLVIDTSTIIGYGKNPDLLGNLNSNLFVVVYQDTSNYTYLASFTISNAGVISAIIDTYDETTARGAGGSFGNLFHTIENSFLLAIADTELDGVVYSYILDVSGVISWVDTYQYEGIVSYTHALMEIDSSGVYGVVHAGNTNDGWVTSFGVELLTGAILYQPITIVNGTTLVDRTAVPQNGIITWGTNPSGVTAVLGGLASLDQPAAGATVDDPLTDILPAVATSDWFGDQTVSGTLLANPFRPFARLMSDTTTITELQAWRLLALAFILGVTVTAIAAVRGHLMIAGIASGAAIGLSVAWTIFPLWALVFAIGTVMGGLISERSPSL